MHVYRESEGGQEVRNNAALRIGELVETKNRGESQESSQTASVEREMRCLLAGEDRTMDAGELLSRYRAGGMTNVTAANHGPVRWYVLFAGDGRVITGPIQRDRINHNDDRRREFLQRTRQRRTDSSQREYQVCNCTFLDLCCVG